MPSPNQIVPRRGLMFVLSSPSGAGKSTITRALMERHDDLTMSVSATTRSPRPGEIDGEHYHFISVDEHKRMVRDGEFLEHARVFDNFYGTPRKPVEDALASGRDVLFDIDWQGAQQLESNAGDDMVSVFILPPSAAELEERLKKRAQDPPEVIARRMAKSADEMSHWNEYQYIVINVDIEESIRQVEAILVAERLRKQRQISLADFVNDMRGERG